MLDSSRKPVMSAWPVFIVNTDNWWVAEGKSHGIMWALVEGFPNLGSLRQ